MNSVYESLYKLTCPLTCKKEKKYFKQCILWTCWRQAVKRRYCVIVYVVHFWPSGFGPISVRSLLYMPRSRFLWKYRSSIFHHRLTLFVATESARVVRKRGGEGGVTRVATLFFSDVRTKLFLRAIYSAKPRPDSGSQSLREMVRRSLKIMREYNPATEIAIQPLIRSYTCEMGSSIFSAMRWLKFASTTRVSYPRMPSTDRTGGENFYHCSWKCLPCLSLFCFSKLIRSLSISSCFYVSVSASPNWCQWCSQSGVTIRSKWVCQLFSPILPSPDVPPPLICFGPGGWGVFRIHSYRERLAERGRGARHALFCDTRWQSLRCCISVCDVQRRMWPSCNICFEG